MNDVNELLYRTRARQRALSAILDEVNDIVRVGVRVRVNHLAAVRAE